MTVAVIVVAAGSGTRLGADVPKAFVPIHEHTVLWHALRGVAAAAVDEVVVVAPAGWELDAQADADAAGVSVRIATGGSTRQRSVASGLRALGEDVEVVLVHDAARALTPPAVFRRVIDAVRASGSGAVPALAVVDTIKRVDGHIDGGRVAASVDRTPLVTAQTPQGFDRGALVAAYEDADDEHTDDSALFARAGHPVTTVPGDERSFKVTTPDDLERARHLVAVRAPRVGVGTDVHAFGGGDLWLAGLYWPGEPALSGHSDGDAVAHAIVDALLSAAGLGDIGTHFGLGRPEFAGAHADVFLLRTREILAEAGWVAVNVSVQVQAARPRFAARRAEAEAVLSAALGAPVSVAATTTDGLGFVGEGAGVQAFAVALVSPV